MGALINFVFFMLLNFVLVNARKLSFDNSSFYVELIHRDPPQGASRWRLSLGSVSHNHNISLSSAYYESKNVQTKIIPDGGAYDMKIKKIGTPPMEFTAIADTGSDLVWLQCYQCDPCIEQSSPFYDPTQSSTFDILPCSSQFCNAQEPGLSGGTSCEQDVLESNDGSCYYQTAYGGGTTTFGALSTETISFSSSNTSPTFPSFVFGCGLEQQGVLDSQGGGIVGLGGGPLSLVSQLGPNFNYKFSYCLTSRTSGVNSRLIFGSPISGPGVVSTPFTKQDNVPTFYFLILDGISIGDTSIPAANTNIIIDSGTTITFLPQTVYDGIKSALTDAIMLTPVSDPEGALDLCYMGESVANIPNSVFHFRGADVVLMAENTFRTLDGVTCLTMLPSDNLYIYGNIAQVNFEVGFDLQANLVSFAPTDCTKF